MKRKQLIIFLLIFSLFSLADAYAGWGEITGTLESSKTYPLPTPAFAQEVRKETSQIMGRNCLITIYKSSQAFSQIAEFYRQRLGLDGWQEITADKKLIQDTGMQMFSDTMVFKKEDNIVNIHNLPSYESQQTFFSVGHALFSVSEEEQDKLRLEAEKKESASNIPAYPNATLAPLAAYQTSSGQQWAYNTADSPAAVLSFYRQNMPWQGWVLEEEIPLTKQGYNPEDYKNCPQCQAAQAQLKPDLQNQILKSSLVLGSLRFKKGDEICLITAIELADGNVNKSMISVSLSKEEVRIGR